MPKLNCGVLVKWLWAGGQELTSKKKTLFKNVRKPGREMRFEETTSRSHEEVNGTFEEWEEILKC